MLSWKVRPMKVNKAEFIISAVSPKQYPEDGLPEIAFAGRSNVGKSSLINMLISRKKLARTSSTPGKTQTINFYRIEDILYMVDLQGYGYAKVSKKSKESWGRSIERYLHERQTLMSVFLLVDIRHEPSELDRVMFNWIRQEGYHNIVLATKMDKIPRSRREEHLNRIRRTLSMDGEDLLIPVSVKTKAGYDAIWEVIDGKMAEFDLL